MKKIYQTRLPSTDLLIPWVVYIPGAVFLIKSIKRELETRPTYDCRCDERPEPKDDESTCLVYTGVVFYFILLL
jgi:hypothetical protein